MKKGYFITFEGPDGSGKTTVSTAVAKRLQEAGIESIYTREPGGIEIAEQIRSVILDPANTAMDSKTEALLYAAARRQHLIEKVLPALEAGKVVICDRFVDSSLAYQGVGRNLGIEEVLSINEFAIEGHWPDKTLYLDLAPQQGLDRIATRQNKDRLDQEKIDFHLRVCEGYRQVRDRFAERMIVIDAAQPVDQVIADCVKAIGALICGGCLVLVSVPMFGLAHSNKQKARSLSLQGRNLASPLPNGSVSYSPGVSLCLNF